MTYSVPTAAIAQITGKRAVMGASGSAGLCGSLGRPTGTTSGRPCVVTSWPVVRLPGTFAGGFGSSPGPAAAIEADPTRSMHKRTTMTYGVRTGCVLDFISLIDEPSQIPNRNADCAPVLSKESLSWRGRILLTPTVIAPDKHVRSRDYPRGSKSDGMRVQQVRFVANSVAVRARSIGRCLERTRGNSNRRRMPPSE